MMAPTFPASPAPGDAGRPQDAAPSPASAAIAQPPQEAQQQAAPPKVDPPNATPLPGLDSGSLRNPVTEARFTQLGAEVAGIREGLDQLGRAQNSSFMGAALSVAIVAMALALVAVLGKRVASLSKQVAALTEAAS